MPKTARKTFKTQPQVAAIPPAPTGQREWHWDAKIPGLAVLTTDSGSKSYYWTRRHAGRLHKLRLGPVESYNLIQARDWARDRSEDCRAGRDPSLWNRPVEKPPEPTLAELFNEWNNCHGNRLRAIKEWTRIFNVYLADWHKRGLGSITKLDVIKLRDRIATKHGMVQAHRVVSLLKMLWTGDKSMPAAKRLGWDGACPAYGVGRIEKEQPRSRRMSPDENVRFSAALAAETNPIIQGFFAMCIYTGSRRGALQKMRWSEIGLDLQGRPVWHCPMTKRGVSQDVSLIPEAVELLRQLRQFGNGSPYVFPQQRVAKRGKVGPGYFRDPMGAWRRICERAELPDLNIHDIRRCVGTAARRAGFSMDDVGESLGHAPGSKLTATTYALIDDSAQRAVLSAGAAAIMGPLALQAPQAQLPAPAAPQIIDVEAREPAAV